MAQIKGREEQNQALKDIRAYIQTIDKMNLFIDNLDKAVNGFNIQYSIVEVNQASDHSESENYEEPKKKGRKANNKKEFSAICHFEDTSFIREQVIKSKISIKNEIYTLAMKYNIELDAEEEAVVNLYCGEL